MAVLKANYVRGKGAAAAIKASIEYMMHRVNRDGEKVTRELFGHDVPIEKEQFFQVIDNADAGTYFYRFVISPDPNSEDLEKILDLWNVTLKTILRLEERVGQQLQFIAADHTDQTEIRHVHAIVLLSRRLTVADLRALRLAATNAALSRQPELERQPEQHQQLEQQVPQQEQPDSVPARQAEPDSSARVGKPFREFTCPACETGHMVKLTSGVYRCPECSLVLGRGQGIEGRSMQFQLQL